MRLALIGCTVACMFAGVAEAAPARPAQLNDTNLPIVRARWTCNQYKCLDKWTGNETRSFCDEDGCHPTRAYGPRDESYEPPPPRPRFGYGYRFAPPPPPPHYGYDED